MANDSANHDAYALDYDDQVKEYDCNVADVLFGMCVAHIQPGQQILDAGIGTGLSAELFAKAGLTVTGMDFSPVMLEICRTKGLASELIQHDLLSAPWPVEQAAFDLVICCGVMHFIADLDVIFQESYRALRDGGVFAFTTRSGQDQAGGSIKYDRHWSGEFEIFSHLQSYILGQIEANHFNQLDQQPHFVGSDQFDLWVVQKTPAGKTAGSPFEKLRWKNS